VSLNRKSLVITHSHPAIRGQRRAIIDWQQRQVSKQSVSTADRPLHDAHGVRLHYIDRGQGDPVVLLHGSGTLIQNFTVSGLVDRLASRYRVVVTGRAMATASDRAGCGLHGHTPSCSRQRSSGLVRSRPLCSATPGARWSEWLSRSSHLLSSVGSRSPPATTIRQPAWTCRCLRHRRSR
jgi:hypothetical protein